MDNLIDIDIKATTPRNHVEMNPDKNSQPNTGLDFLLDLNTKLPENQNQNPDANAQVDALQDIFGNS